MPTHQRPPPRHPFILGTVTTERRVGGLAHAPIGGHPSAKEPEQVVGVLARLFGESLEISPRIADDEDGIAARLLPSGSVVPLQPSPKTGLGPAEMDDETANRMFRSVAVDQSVHHATAVGVHVGDGLLRAKVGHGTMLPEEVFCQQTLVPRGDPAVLERRADAHRLVTALKHEFLRLLHAVVENGAQDPLTVSVEQVNLLTDDCLDGNGAVLAGEDDRIAGEAVADAGGVEGKGVLGLGLVELQGDLAELQQRVRLHLVHVGV